MLLAAGIGAYRTQGTASRAPAQFTLACNTLTVFKKDFRATLACIIFHLLLILLKYRHASSRGEQFKRLDSKSRVAVIIQFWAPYGYS